MIAAGVIGWPVAHSKSPLIHRFWLAKLGIDGDYGRFAVAPERLGDAIRALPALGLRGVNVTVPHKVAVMASLDRVDHLAAKVGAVNTVVVEDGVLVGYNTDVQGFLEPLLVELTASGTASSDHRVTLIGTGGAARAVGLALASWQGTVHGRTADRADRLARDLAASGFICEAGSVAELADQSRVRFNDRYRHYVVNATTLGMTGQPPLDIDLTAYPPDTIVYDLVYAPLETPLLAAARARGLRTIDGLAMLIGQAAAAFELFFGAAAPREHDAELRALLVTALHDKSL